MFSTQFLVEGIRRDEPGVFVTFEESPDDIRRNMTGFGWDIPTWEAQGRWLFMDASLQPGEMVVIQDGVLRRERYAPRGRTAHCFFEWVYFANVASTLDQRSVYLSRSALGVELAKQERELNRVPLDADTVVVPVPDTGKAAADAMAYELKVPSVEGLIRNRYIGRTFIEGQNRAERVQLKYTPLREVLAGKRVLLIEDTIVRSTTMKALLHDLRERGGAREVHVRVACPPIIAPCFYGIDMSTVRELFAPRFMHGSRITQAEQEAMARELDADSLAYLPLESVARCIGLPANSAGPSCATVRNRGPSGSAITWPSPTGLSPRAR